MLGSRYYRPRVLSAARHCEHVAASPFLGDDADPALVPSVRHPLLNSRVNQNQNTLAEAVVSEKTAKGNLSPVARLTAENSPALVANTMGTFQESTPRVEIQRLAKAPYILLSSCTWFLAQVSGWTTRVRESPKASEEQKQGPQLEENEPVDEPNVIGG